MRARSSDVRIAIDAFRRIVQALRTSSREAERRVGISAAQLFALHQLAGRAGASINDLAALTFTDQSSVSVVVKRLVERRLVIRRAAAGDRRRVRLEITPTGRAVLRSAPEPVQERLIAAINAFRPRQRALLANTLGAIAAAVAEGKERPTMFFEDGGSQRRARSAPRAS
jgi:DNA-binding MarR family transcriptional regulator